MKRRGITLIEIVVVITVIVTLVAIIKPVFRRTTRFHATEIPPQQFNRVPLQQVISKLDQALQVSRGRQGKKPVKYLKKIVWKNPSLKSRTVTFNTQDPTPLKEVLIRLEQAADVKVNFGAACGTCDSFDGPTTVSDTSKQR